MHRTTSQHALARRALLEDTPARASRWARSGVAVLAVSVLGVGAAGSVNSPGSTEHTARNTAAAPAGAAAFGTQMSVVTSTPVPPAAGAHELVDQVDRLALVRATSERRAERAERAEARAARARALVASAAAAANQVAEIAHQRQVRATRAQAAEHRKARSAARAKVRAAARARVRAAAHARATRAKAAHVRAERKHAQQHRAEAVHARARHQSQSRSSHRGQEASLPVTSGYHIAARFGGRGSWSRYHTGIDFAAPVGTRIHAAAAGVVTHAGRGSAGWAGRYVTIRHAGGRSTLMAHMSRVSVHVGQHVSAGRVVGAVGMTGRTFGPHVHFELYPAGVRPGNLYHAVNPAPWLRGMGLHV